METGVDTKFSVKYVPSTIYAKEKKIEKSKSWYHVYLIGKNRKLEN